MILCCQSVSEVIKTFTQLPHNQLLFKLCCWVFKCEGLCVVCFAFCVIVFGHTSVLFHATPVSDHLQEYHSVLIQFVLLCLTVHINVFCVRFVVSCYCRVHSIIIARSWVSVNIRCVNGNTINYLRYLLTQLRKYILSFCPADSLCSIVLL